MNTQKVPKALLILMAVIVISGVGYFAYKNSNEGKISYSGQWTQAQFPQNGYNHSVNIMLPSTWEFNCCGDTSSFSAHAVYPLSSKNNLETSPHITVYDFALYGCPNSAYEGCSIDQRNKVTANQYMTSLVNHLTKKGEVGGLESLKRTGTLKLSNITTEAIAYSGTSRSGQLVELYLIQSNNGVVGVAFQQPQQFDPKLKTEFLNRITNN